MVVRDFRVGNTILSAYAFGLNAQQFEVLEGVNGGSKLLYTIDQYPLNLIKVRLEAQDIIDNTDPANPVTLAEFPFDVSFTNILEGAQGLIIVDNSTATTKLRFEPTTIQVDEGSNLSIKKNGNTVLRFVHENGIFHIQSDYRPIWINLNKTIELEVNNSLEPTNSRFLTIKDCVKYIIANAGASSYDKMFATDTAYETIIVNIHYGLGLYNEAFYVPNLGLTGVHFRGIPDAAGNKPVIDATNIINQFNRTVNVYGSKNVMFSNLHFKRGDNGSVLLLVTRDSRVTIENCTFENGSMEGPKSLIQAAANSQIRLFGEIEIISASGVEEKMFLASEFSKIGLTNMIDDPNSPNGRNRNAGLSIKVNSPITWNTIFEASRYSQITTDDYLDGGSGETLRYNPGSILYQTLAKVETGAEVINNSLTFPG